MKKVILYVRVSTDEQARTGYSLGHQEAVLTRFAGLKEFEMVKIFREDHSAKNFNRPDIGSFSSSVKHIGKKLTLF